MYVSCLLMAVLYLLKLKKTKLDNTIEDYILLIYLSIVIISTLFSVNIYQSLAGGEFREEGLAALLCYFFIYFIVSRYYIFEEKHIKYLLTSALIVSIYAIVQYFGIDPLKVKSHLTGAVSTMGNRNFLGSYLTLIMPISMFLFIRSRKIIYFILSGIFFMALLCSYTRGAWIAFLACMILFVYLVYKHKLSYRRYLGLIVLFFIIGIAFNITDNNQTLVRARSIGKDIAKTFDSSSSSESLGSGRIYIWKNALRLIPDRPILGSGPDTFGIVFMRKFDGLKSKTYDNNGKPFEVEVYIDKAHNEYLQIAVTNGVPAAIIYISFIVLIIVKTNKYMDHNALVIPVSAAVISYCVQAFFNISVVSVAPLFWVFIGLSENFIRKEYKH